MKSVLRAMASLVLTAVACAPAGGERRPVAGTDGAAAPSEAPQIAGSLDQTASVAPAPAAPSGYLAAEGGYVTFGLQSSAPALALDDTVVPAAPAAPDFGAAAADPTADTGTATDATTTATSAAVDIPVPADLDAFVASAATKSERFTVKCGASVPKLAGQFFTVVGLAVADVKDIVETVKIGGDCAAPTVAVAVDHLGNGVPYAVVAFSFETLSHGQRLLAHGASPAFTAAAGGIQMTGDAPATVELQEYVPTSASQGVSLGGVHLTVDVAGASAPVSLQLTELVEGLYPASAPAASATTDAQTGSATLDGLRPSTYLVTATADGTAPVTTLVAFGTGDAGKEISVQLGHDPAGVCSAHVTVASDSGLPLRAVVQLTRTDAPGAAAQVAAAGDTVFTGLPCGTYAATATRDGWRSGAAAQAAATTIEKRTATTRLVLIKE